MNDRGGGGNAGSGNAANAVGTSTRCPGGNVLEPSANTAA